MTALPWMNCAYLSVHRPGKLDKDQADQADQAVIQCKDFKLL